MTNTPSEILSRLKEVKDMAPKEEKTYTPSDLAEELDVDPKRIRAYLRAEFTRPGEAKNTSWTLDEEMAEAVRDRFMPADDEDEDEVEETEELDSEES